jgi:pyruvate kinase
MQDLKGLKIRVGPIRDKSAFIKKDSELILTTRKIKGDSTRIQVGYPDLVSDVIAGAPVEDVVSKGFAQALAEAAYFSSEDIGAKTIVAFSRSGFTALLVSKFRPRVPVTCFTASSSICRKACLFWGVSPYFMKFPDNTDEMINESEKPLLKKGIVKKRDDVVIIASSPFALGGKSNILKLHKVGC